MGPPSLPPYAFVVVRAGRVDRPGAGLGVNRVGATGERVPPAETCLSEFPDDR